jgi:hypothetical protein
MTMTFSISWLYCTVSCGPASWFEHEDCFILTHEPCSDSFGLRVFLQGSREELHRVFIPIHGHGRFRVPPLKVAFISRIQGRIGPNRAGS